MVLCAALLLSASACGESGVKPANAAELIASLTTKIEGAGYSYTAYSAAEQDEDAPEIRATKGSIEAPGGTLDDAVYVVITETKNGVKSVVFSFDHASKDQTLEKVTYLAGMLMQVCDPSLGRGKAAAIRAAKAVISATDRAERYEKNGYSYEISLYRSGVDFEVAFPKQCYALSAKELAAEQGRTVSEMSLSKADFQRDFGAMVGVFGYKLESWNESMGSLDLERNDTLLETPEIWVIAHQSGFIEDALLIYGDEDTIYRIELVKTDWGSYFLDFDREAAMLIQYFDCGIGDDPQSNDLDDALALLGQIEKESPLSQNGFSYTIQGNYDDEWFSIEAQ